MPRLRRSDPCTPGLTRKWVGRAFRYVDDNAARVGDDWTLAHAAG